ncbi:MAG: CHASE domain-containing protein, partial [Burkholderiaceae bacterium]|nr:CHASE domain-containing protein [Burkholderiaceae bacterium]
MKRIGRATLAGVATLCAGLLLAAAAASWQAKHNREHAEGAFDALAQRVGADVSARLALYEYGLRAVRGAAVSPQGAHIGREAFRLYTASRETDREFPGARGFGVIWRVPQADEAAFVERAGHDGWPDFKVRQLAPHDGERFVIELIEPVERNYASVGLDVASEANRREAALTSMRSGQATLTGPITLVQVTGKPLRSFLV